jgi:hypothetical protein
MMMMLGMNINTWKQRFLPGLLFVTLLLFCYLVCLKMGWVSLFLSLLSRVGVSLGAKALSFFLVKMGCSGGLALAIGFAVRALLATEAAPSFGNAVSPGREPELDLRLGLPGVQVEDEDPEGLSPAERELRDHLNTNSRGGRTNISLDDIQAMVSMKEEIVTRIAQLDPNPFWAEQRARLISDYIVTPKREEYSLQTLEKIWKEVGAATTQDHYFVKRMIKLREDYQLLGRFLVKP